MLASAPFYRCIDTSSTNPLLSKYEIYSPNYIFCSLIAQPVSDLVGNPEDRFSQNAAQISFLIMSTGLYMYIFL